MLMWSIKLRQRSQAYTVRKGLSPYKCGENWHHKLNNDTGTLSHTVHTEKLIKVN